MDAPTDPLAGIVFNIHIGQGTDMSSALADAGVKFTKAEVNYRPAPDDKGKSIPDECATCDMYFTKGGGMGYCTLVAGDIHPEGICNEYTPGDLITNKEEIRNWGHFQEKKVPDWWYYTGPYSGG